MTLRPRNYGEMQFDHPKVATPVHMERITDCGPGEWWFVHHPDGYLIEVGLEFRAKRLAFEINAGLSALDHRAALAQAQTGSTPTHTTGD